jgi:hypothetical protein
VIQFAVMRSKTPPLQRLRQASALPLYAVALLLDYLGAALGRLAALIAGDSWPG